MPDQQGRRTLTDIPAWLKNDLAKEDDRKYAGAIDPTTGMSIVQLLMAGVGKSMADASIAGIRTAEGLSPERISPILRGLLMTYPQDLNGPLEGNFYGRAGDVLGIATPIAPAAGRIGKALLSTPNAYGLLTSTAEKIKR